MMMMMMSLLSKLDADTVQHTTSHIQKSTQALMAKAFNNNQLGYKQTIELDRLNLKARHMGDALELNTLVRHAIHQDPLGKVNRTLDKTTPHHHDFKTTLHQVKEALVQLPHAAEAFRVNNTLQRIQRLEPVPVRVNPLASLFNRLA